MAFIFIELEISGSSTAEINGLVINQSEIKNIEYKGSPIHSIIIDYCDCSIWMHAQKDFNFREFIGKIAQKENIFMLNMTQV